MDITVDHLMATDTVRLEETLEIEYCKDKILYRRSSNGDTYRWSLDRSNVPDTWALTYEEFTNPQKTVISLDKVGIVPEFVRSRWSQLTPDVYTSQGRYLIWNKYMGTWLCYLPRLESVVPLDELKWT